MTERTIEDLNLNEAQREAIAQGKLVIEAQRRADEAHAKLVAPAAPKKWKPIPGWRIALNKLGRWLRRLILRR
jgi:hypothetical protein